MNKQNIRCAPGITFKAGSCINFELILDIVLAYNQSIEQMETTGQKIQLLNNHSNVDKNKYKQYMVNELTLRFKNNQKEWIKQKFIKNMNKNKQYELLNLVFRPDADSLDPNNWLNSNEIVNVMKQYEEKYPDFYYMGTVPVDFPEYTPAGINTFDFTKSLLTDKKTKYGMIINLDEHYKSGSHWVGLYFSFDHGKIFYFDSTKRKPDVAVEKYMNHIKNLMNQNGTQTVEINYNKYQHQYENTECGVYAINFILRMLKGDMFGDICRSRIPDKDINKCRETYFSNVNVK
jgi:hypothetical protein